MIYFAAYYITGIILFAHIIYKSGTLTVEDIFGLIFVPIAWPAIVPIYWITRNGDKIVWRIRK